MEEQNDKFIAKFIYKPYDDYCSKTKELLKSEQCLQLTYIAKPKDDNRIYSYYADKIKTLKAKYRTVLFYGIPIQLSKQQFYLLYLLIVDGNIRESDYAELSEALYGRKMKKSAIDSNLKSFVSDFIVKVYKAIRKYKDNSYFANMTDKQIYQIISKLINYKKQTECYIIKSYFMLKNERLV